MLQNADVLEPSRLTWRALPTRGAGASNVAGRSGGASVRTCRLSQTWDETGRKISQRPFHSYDVSTRHRFGRPG